MVTTQLLEEPGERRGGCSLILLCSLLPAPGIDQLAQAADHYTVTAAVVSFGGEDSGEPLQVNCHDAPPGATLTALDPLVDCYAQGVEAEVRSQGGTIRLDIKPLLRKGLSQPLKEQLGVV